MHTFLEFMHLRTYQKNITAYLSRALLALAFLVAPYSAFAFGTNDLDTIARDTGKGFLSAFTIPLDFIVDAATDYAHFTAEVGQTVAQNFTDAAHSSADLYRNVYTFTSTPVIDTTAALKQTLIDEVHTATRVAREGSMVLANTTRDITDTTRDTLSHLSFSTKDFDGLALVITPFEKVGAAAGMLADSVVDTTTRTLDTMSTTVDSTLASAATHSRTFTTKASDVIASVTSSARDNFNRLSFSQKNFGGLALNTQNQTASVFGAVNEFWTDFLYTVFGPTETVTTVTTPELPPTPQTPTPPQIAVTPPPTPSGTTVVNRITQPVITRTIEHTTERVLSGITATDLEAQIASLRSELLNEIAKGKATAVQDNNALYLAMAPMNRINNLSSVTISNPTITGASISSGTLSGTFSGSVTGTTGSFSGALALSATTTSSNGFDITAGCFSVNGTCVTGGGAGTPGGSDTQIQFNSSSAFAGDSNFIWNNTNKRLGIGTTSPYATLSVAGASVLGNSALAGYFTATTTTASVFPYASTTAITVSGNAYLPGSGVWNSSGNVGIGTTSPYAKLSVHAYSGENNTTLFAIASSTASATTSLLTVLNTGNVGIGTTSPTQKFEIENGHMRFSKYPAPRAATATLGAFTAGAVTAGSYTYKITFVTASGETELGTISNSVTVPGTAYKVELTNVPLGPSGTISRRIYRSKLSNSAFYARPTTGYTISDNTTTTFTDTANDSFLTVYGPNDNTTSGRTYVNGSFGSLLGEANTTFGYQAGLSATSGFYNTFIGALSGRSVTTGGEMYQGNTFVGYSAGYTTSTGVTNTFVGTNAGWGNTIGSQNSFFGVSAGDDNTTGIHNAFFGVHSGYYNQTGSYNTYLGPYAGDDGMGSGETALDGSIAIGYRNKITASRQLVIGSANINGQITDAYLGSGVSTTSPLGITLNASGAEGTNIAGASLTFAGGKATGNASGGSIIFNTSDAGSSGSTAQSLSEKMRITSTGNVGIGTTTPYAKLSVVGEIVSSYFTATSTTATSTFANHISIGAGKSYRIDGNPVLSGSASYLAVGINDASSCGSCVAVGYSNIMSNGSNIAMGIGNTSSGTLYSTAVGNNNTASGSGGLAFGNDNTASGNNSVAFGSVNTSSADSSLAVGLNNTASVANSIAIGAGITNSTGGSLQIGPSDAAKLTILSTGNIGIGTTTPFSKLTIASGDVGVFNGALCADNGGLAKCYGSLTAGVVYGDSSSFVASDVAENYPAADSSLEAGDIVMVATALASKEQTKRAHDKEKLETLYKDEIPASIKETLSTSIEKATTEGGYRIIGVVSTAPGVLLGDTTGLDLDTTFKPVALSGRVPLKVNNEGGEIKAGDPIALSSVPGIGTKATTASRAFVGTALEDFSGAEGKILVFINLSSARLDTAITAGTIGKGQSSFWDIDDSTGRLKYIAALDLNDFDIVNVKAINAIGSKWSIDAFGRMVVEEVKTNKLCVGETCVDESMLKKILEKVGIFTTVSVDEPTSTPAPTEPTTEPPAEQAPITESTPESAPTAEQPSESTAETPTPPSAPVANEPESTPVVVEEPAEEPSSEPSPVEIIAPPVEPASPDASQL